MLVEQGHDVAFVADLAPSVDDRGVFALARQQGRVLVTLDADFGELIFRHGAPPPLAVIYVRIHPISSPAAAALSSDFKGQFVVATGDALRRWSLHAPDTSEPGTWARRWATQGPSPAARSKPS